MRLVSVITWPSQPGNGTSPVSVVPGALGAPVLGVGAGVPDDPLGAVVVVVGTLPGSVGVGPTLVGAGAGCVVGAAEQPAANASMVTPRGQLEYRRFLTHRIVDLSNSFEVYVTVTATHPSNAWDARTPSTNASHPRISARTRPAVTVRLVCFEVRRTSTTLLPCNTRAPDGEQSLVPTWERFS